MELLKSVLIIGGNGREHALLKALLRSERALCLWAYPGNPGMVADGCQIVDRPIDGWAELAEWAKEQEIDLVVVGPELPLVEGIADLMHDKGIAVFGPSQKAAQIEGSKEFAKLLMKKYKIPTAEFEVHTTKASAMAHLKKHGAPIVVKASGLAAGKGAIVCETVKEAESALKAMFDTKVFGDAANSVVLEGKMEGEEASVFVLTDGKTYKILPVAQDHKQIGEGDTGLNTGGMGAYAPAPIVDKKLLKRIEDDVIIPTLSAMKKEKCVFTGLLYVGIMVTKDGPKVVEFNCRFGDPETQAVLPLVSCDWFEILNACATGKLANVEWHIAKKFSVAITLAAKGYPGKFEKGKRIKGIHAAEYNIENVDVYHAGTALDKEGHLVSNGGRVLTVTAWEPTLEKAIHTAYNAISHISYNGKIFRKDIGAKGLARLTVKKK